MTRNEIEKRQKPFNPHLIRTKLMKRAHWSAYVTWKGMDLKEFGETQRNAVLFLFQKHFKYFGIDETEIPEYMRRIGSLKIKP